MSKKKLVVLGGGTAAMAAVWGITSSPNWRDNYESITVYQLGWRLGGKGASGRGPNGRIQEHGLHIWLGFYENAFRTMREVLAEMDENDAAFRSIEEAFIPHSLVGVMEKIDDKWDPWLIHFPTRPGEPGDGTPRQLTTVWQAIAEAFDVMVTWIESEFDDDGGELSQALNPLANSGDGLLDRIFGFIGSILGFLKAKSGKLTLRLLVDLLDEQVEDLAKDNAFFIERLLELLDLAMDDVAQGLADASGSTELRRIATALDISSAVLRGLLANRDAVNKHGLSVFDDMEFQDFLKTYGALESSYDIEQSAAIRGLYDLVFAFEDGDSKKPNFAAGVALRSAMCVFLLYKKEIFMKMSSGMGDTIFAPFHKALVKRGVEFKFFHRLEEMQLQDRPGETGAKFVGKLIFNKQATVKDGDYNPYVSVSHMDCWPQAPLTDQLLEGDEIKAGPAGNGVDDWSGDWQGYDLEDFWTTWKGVETVELSADAGDFDEVILAIPPASHKFICPELVSNSARWEKMVDSVASTQTLALQLWMKSSIDGLGWHHGTVAIDAFQDPFNTWADMTDLIDREDWPIGASLGSIAYFCGPLPGGLPAKTKKGVTEQAKATVASQAISWLDTAPGVIWPDAAAPTGALKSNQTVTWDFEVGPGILKGQYWRANVSPSERYVNSFVGTISDRLGPSETGCDNLFLAGDWTANDFNAGCVEAAVMSGLLCSNAMCGFPESSKIERYW